MFFFNRVPCMQIPDMIPGVNIISRKVILVSISRAGGSRGVVRPQQGFREWSTLKNFLDSKEHLDWLKIDFNAAKIITGLFIRYISKK